MYELSSYYINTFIQNFQKYLETVQEFYKENTYLCMAFFVNYTFLYFLYVYYIKNLPKDIENNLRYFTNLSGELSTRNIYIENMLNELNVLCNDLSLENTKLSEAVKNGDLENQSLKREKNESKFLIDKLREKLFVTEKNVKELKTVITNLDTFFKNGDEYNAGMYLSDFLTPRKKRKFT
jgi:hypothetical protein